MATHYVLCKDCGKEIANWSGSWHMNYQKHEKWVCQGKVQVDCSKDNVFAHKDGTRSHVFIMDGGAGTQVETPPDAIRLKTEKRRCSVVNDTTYCRGCAKKHDFKCPECGGAIELERKP